MIQVERVAGRSIRYEIDYEVLWDGRKQGPGGALLSPPEVPTPPRVLPFAFVPAPAAKPSISRRPPGLPGQRKRSSVVPTHIGPVWHARQGVWDALARPITVRDIALRLGLMPHLHTLHSAIAKLLAYGAIRHAGMTRKPGSTRMVLKYERHPRYRNEPVWPDLPQARGEA